MKYECECGQDFHADSATSCPSCGSSYVSSSPVIASPGASQAAETSKEDCIPLVRVTLQKLCQDTYDAAYDSAVWDELIEQAIESLKPYLRQDGNA